MLLEDLIKRVPFDTRTHVERTVKRLNPAIRQALREETALRLRRDADSGQASAERLSVPIALTPGLPSVLRNRELDEEKFVVAAHLAPYRRMLEQLRDGSSQTRDLLGGRPGVPLFRLKSPLAETTLEASRAIAEELLWLASPEGDDWNFAKWVLEVDDDVLGAYHWRTNSLWQVKPRISLYWAVIGLIAQVIGVSTEALTTVVLAHELAHAYTHVGVDIDGKTWETMAFERAERPVLEGLAQYYAWRVCLRIQMQSPDSVGAFQELLKDQPEPYRAHEPWVEHHQPEEIRFAMLQARRSEAAGMEVFWETLTNAQEGLRASRKRRPMLRSDD